jgi:hypothetical protein
MSWIVWMAAARAAELVGPAAPPEVAPEVEAYEALKSSNGKKKKKKKDDDSGGATSKKGKLWGWTYRPYVSPGGGVNIANGGAAVTGAVDVGVRYHKDNWKGDLQLGGAYTTGAALNGWDVHAGNEFGRREKWWGLTAGLVGFYNQYLDEDGKKSLDPSIGLDVPIEATVGPRKYYGFAGVTPSFLFNKDRHVASLPFGDELEWNVGAGLKLKWITAEVGFAQRITTIGTINTPTISVSISGLD